MSHPPSFQGRPNYLGFQDHSKHAKSPHPSGEMPSAENVKEASKNGSEAVDQLQQKVKTINQRMSTGWTSGFTSGLNTGSIKGLTTISTRKNLILDISHHIFIEPNQSTQNP